MKPYKKHKTHRYGLGCYFIQFNFDYWWQILIRFGRFGIGINRCLGFFIRDFKIYSDNLEKLMEEKYD